MFSLVTRIYHKQYTGNESCNQYMIAKVQPTCSYCVTILWVYKFISHYHQPNTLPLPAIIKTQVTICNTIQNVLAASAFFTSFIGTGKNSGESSSLIPIGIPTVRAHVFRKRLCPLMYYSSSSLPKLAKNDLNFVLSVSALIGFTISPCVGSLGVSGSLSCVTLLFLFSPAITLAVDDCP